MRLSGDNTKRENSKERKEQIMCNRNNFNEVMANLAQLKAMANELQAEIKQAEDELKAYMEAEGVGVLQGIEHKATWKEVTSSRLDTKALKVDLPEIADKYSKTSTTMRFNFS